ncbi:MAG: hypothetical protein ACRDKZ_05885, partial [Actinomycetota bacterium]
ELTRVEGGWGNAFSLDASQGGGLELDYPRSTSDGAWLIAMPLLWVFMVGAAFPSGSGQRAKLETSRRTAPRRRQPE